jgi:acyl-CoA synthetase (AMP-forming)/AMP-acid ligase II
LGDYCETQISKTNNLKVTIGELKFVGRTIPQSGGYKTPQLALGFHTRDSFYKCPKAVVFWDSIPTTIVGKIDKKFI